MKSQASRATFFLGSMLILAPVCSLSLGCSGSEGTKPNKEKPEPANLNVNKENFVKIKLGMKAWEVKDLLGSGDLIEEKDLTEKDGTPGGGRPPKRVRTTFKWRNGEQWITVTFENDSVQSKEGKVN